MRNLLLVLFLCAGLCLLLSWDTRNAPACAQEDGSQLLAAGGAKLEMSDIIIRKKGKQINLRTMVTNQGGDTASALNGNLTVYLYVKDDAGKWKEVQKWSNAQTIKAGEKSSRDYTPIEALTEFQKGTFTVKAEIKLAAPIKGVAISKAAIEKSFPADATVEP